MQVNRRDLLKFFGIGATIVPVLNGLPKVEMPAKLIEEPKVELVSPIGYRFRDVLCAFNNRERIKCEFTMIRPNGHTSIFECAEAIIRDLKTTNPIDGSMRVDVGLYLDHRY